MDCHAFLTIGSARSGKAIFNRLLVQNINMMIGASDCGRMRLACVVIDIEDGDFEAGVRESLSAGFAKA